MQNSTNKELNPIRPVRCSEFEFFEVPSDTCDMKIILGILILIAAGAGVFFIHIPDTSSPEYTAWKTQRDLEQVHQKNMEAIFLDPSFTFNNLELIEVGPGDVYYSLWGHVILRFAGSGKTPEEDLAVSFLADFNDHPVNKLKASFGGYEVLPKLDTMKNFSLEYVEGEKRFMNSYVLRATLEQRIKLNSVLRDWVLNKKLPSTYTFVKNNCVGIMMKLFTESGIMTSIDAEEAYWPKNLPDLLLTKGLISQEDYGKYAVK